MAGCYDVPEVCLRRTFSALRRCGKAKRECQVLWVSPWEDPHVIADVVHPIHSASAAGFQIDDRWLTHFWQQLAEQGTGVRVQVHTHPGRAFHSPTDDRWPLIQTPGFLSLVIPGFAMGEIGFDEAYLAELHPNGHWKRVDLAERLRVIA